MVSNDTAGYHHRLGFPASKTIRDASVAYETPALGREVIASYGTKKRTREGTDTVNRWMVGVGNRQLLSFVRGSLNGVTGKPQVGLPLLQ